MSLLSIGLSGLRSSQAALTATGHNISNVNTPGYSRQQTMQEANTPQFSGAGYIGSGSRVFDVRRLASDFLSTQVRTATSQNNELDAFRSQIEQLDSLLSDTTTGISPALQKFFAALQTAAANPSATEGREALLAETQGLSKTFNTLYDQLDTQNGLINQQLGSLASQVNALASSVAEYNDALLKAGANGSKPNDILDARDEAVRKLSELIGVQVVNQDGNSFSLFIGNGQPLVVGNKVSTLQVVPGSDDPGRYQVQLSTGSVTQTITAQISGGQMGGLLAYRDTALDNTYNKLGQIALTFADTVNRQLGQGLDLAGQPGLGLFGDINDPQTAALRVLASSGNSNTVTSSALTITDSGKLETSDYRLDFDGTSFTARRLSDNSAMTVVQSGTGPYTLTLQDASGVDQGFEVTLDALPAAGDRFTLQPTRNGAADIQSSQIKAEQLAFAASARAQSTTNNRGNGSIGQPQLTSGPSPIVLGDLQGLFGSNGLGFSVDATGTTLVGTLPAGASLSYVSPSTSALTPGQTNTLRLDYTDPSTGNNYSYEFTLSGVPQAGDSFSIGLNDKGIADNSNALALSALQSKATVGGSGGTSFNSSYAGLVERIGTLTAQVRNNSDASATVLKQAQDNRDSLSGVNLDEEAAGLIQFQQYYNASAQVVQIARSLFDTLIGTIR